MPGAKYITVTYADLKRDTINILLIDILKEMERDFTDEKLLYFSVGTQLSSLIDVIFGT